MAQVYVGDKGFDISFLSGEDLTVMTGVDMEITRHRKRITNAFLPSEFNTVGVGGDLVYRVRDGDIDAPGWYNFQVIAKRPGVNITFEPLVIKVKG